MVNVLVKYYVGDNDEEIPLVERKTLSFRCNGNIVVRFSSSPYSQNTVLYCLGPHKESVFGSIRCCNHLMIVKGME